MLFLILGLLVGALLLVAALTGLKYAAVVSLILAGLLVLAFVHHRYRNLEVFLLLAFVPLSSLKIDVNLLRVGGQAGFPITPLDVIWGLLMILWLIRLRQGTAQVRLRSVFALPLVVIFCGALIAAARSDSFVGSVRFILLMFECITLFVYLFNRETSEREAQTFCWVFCLTLGAQSLLGVLQGTTGSTFGSQYLGAERASFMEGSRGGVTISRVGGSIGHSNAFALYLNSMIFVPFAAVVSGARGLGRALAPAVFLLGVSALVMTKSRAGWVGFAFCLLLLAFVYFRARIGAPKAAFVVVGLVLILNALVWITPATRARLLSDDYGSARSRIPMALTALNMIAHHPLVGVGEGNYLSHFHDYDRTPEGQTYSFPVAVHNAYLLLAAEFGIPVLLAYLTVLLAFWLAVSRIPIAPEAMWSRTLAYCLGVGLLAQAIMWQTGIARPLSDLYTWFLLGLALSLSRMGRADVASAGDVAQAR